MRFARSTSLGLTAYFAFLKSAEILIFCFHFQLKIRIESINYLQNIAYPQDVSSNAPAKKEVRAVLARKERVKCLFFNETVDEQNWNY
jgi:hypothetical protein